MEFGMRSDDLEDILIEKLVERFKNAAKDFAVKESTDTPYVQLTIEMSLYNYFVVSCKIERNTMFFSILQSGFQLPLFKVALSDSELNLVTATLEQEVRLRIPDKYLKEKGW
jgi:hypothetical protein